MTYMFTIVHYDSSEEKLIFTHFSRKKTAEMALGWLLKKGIKATLFETVHRYN